VAAGYTDGFFETGLQPWDVAAGSLLVTEAGGLVGNFSGDSDFLEQKECMAGNPRVYGQLVSILGKYSKSAPAGEKAAVRQAGPILAADSGFTPEAALIATQAGHSTGNGAAPSDAPF
jgi:myo-inositol-1(or 4)-monophosphatase